MLDLAELAVLQEIDLRLDSVRHDLHGVDDQIGDPPFLATLDDEIGAQAELVKESQSARKGAEVTTDDSRTKIGQEEERLYGGEIPEARELQHLQQEIFGLRRGLSKLEDELLAAQGKEEAEIEASGYLDTLREKSLESWGARQKELLSDRTTIATTADGLQAEVDEQRGHLRKGDLAIYDDHRLRRPQVLAPTAGGVCGSCRLSLPTTIVTRARRAIEPVPCPACGCLVYVP